MAATKPGLPREVERAFWRRIREGLSIEAAGTAVGVSDTAARRWFANGGGMPPMRLADLSGRYLSKQERDHIGLGLAAGLSKREIGRQLGRAPSTISREVTRNSQPGWPWSYLPGNAQSKAERRGRRPKPGKLAMCVALREEVQAQLGGDEHRSPEQISHRLRVDFPDDEQMRISAESIYRALYVQGRGELRRELHRSLRTGRAVRRPQRRPGERRGRIPDMVMISERPAEVEDRAVPGHWEGDLIVGKNSKSAIGTLVERTTRFVMLLHLPADHTAPTVRDAIAATITTLPEALRRSLTWDQGVEMAQHVRLHVDTNVDIYFCDPHSPWQRGTNENTNGLLRQYFPKGTDLSVHSADHLARIAAALNRRPRKTLNWQNPAEALAALLSQPQPTGVATTT